MGRLRRSSPIFLSLIDKKSWGWGRVGRKFFKWIVYVVLDAALLP
jgi:hypothetical protein